LIAEPDLDVGEVERVEDQLDALTHERGVDLVVVAVKRHGRDLRDDSGLGPQERLVELGGGRESNGGQIEPLEGGLAGLGVDPAVIDALDPGGEQPVQLAQVDRGGHGDLDEELVADGPEEPFDLASPLGPPRRRVGEADPQRRARPQQRLRRERRPVVDIDPPGDPPSREPGPQGGFEPHGVFGVTPPIADQQPAVVIDERQQVDLAPGNHRAVQGVADPQHVGRLGLEPAERFGRPPVRTNVEAQPGEQALDRPRRRRPAMVSFDDPTHLGRGARRALELQRDREFQQRCRGLGLRRPRLGDQSVEPAGAPRPDPAVQRGPAHRDPFAVRAEMVAGSEVADQSPALGRRQRRVRGFADQRIAEQRDVAMTIVHKPSKGQRDRSP
jgi:hypothetical protein